MEKRNRGSGMRPEQSEAAEHLELLRPLVEASKTLPAGRALVHDHFSIQRRLRRLCFLAHRLCLQAVITADGSTRRKVVIRLSLNRLRIKSQATS